MTHSETTRYESTIRLPSPRPEKWIAPVALATLPGAAQARIAITLACRDCDVIPKVPDAGRIFPHENETVQLMHDGTLVQAGGYYGDWMSRIIAGLHGHHEPQEETLFHGLLAHVRPGTLFVELGAYWAFYTNWYLGAVPGSRGVCVEPELAHLEMGRRNLALNSRFARLIQAFVGGSYCPAGPEQVVECLDMPALMERIDHEPVEVLHMDIQGAEEGLIRSMRGTDVANRVRFVVVSTHHASISGSTATHQECLEELRGQGAVILDEHSVEVSFSGDGLIVASFAPHDRRLQLPPITRAPAELSSLIWESAGIGAASDTVRGPASWFEKQAVKLSQSALRRLRDMGVVRKAT